MPVCISKLSSLKHCLPIMILHTLCPHNASPSSLSSEYTSTSKGSVAVWRTYPFWKLCVLCTWDDHTAHSTVVTFTPEIPTCTSIPAKAHLSPGTIHAVQRRHGCIHEQLSPSLPELPMQVEKTAGPLFRSVVSKEPEHAAKSPTCPAARTRLVQVERAFCFWLLANPAARLSLVGR